MEIGLQVRGDYREVLEAALWAERKGLAAFALPDHYLASPDDFALPAWDHVVHLAGLARETETIELVDLLSPVTFRHPAVHAKMAVTIADMARRAEIEQRFVMGLGTGWMDAEHELFGFPYPEMKERYEMLAEQLGYLTALRDQVGFSGSHYNLREFESGPEMNVPLLVGGSGSRRTPDLAGRFADEFNLFSNLDNDLAERIETCRRAAVDADRDPDAIRLSFTGTPAAGTDEESYRRTLAEVASDYGRSADELEERFRLRGLPVGTPDQIRERFDELSSHGITRLYLQAGTTDLEKLEARITPYLL